MTPTVTLTKLNAALMKVTASENHITKDLADHFSFLTENYKFSPLYKSGRWDGRIRLYSPKQQTLYRGLADDVISFCKSANYNVINKLDVIDVDENLVSNYVNNFKISVSDGEVNMRDYQIRAAIHAIVNERALLISPTRSGKSAIIYCIIQYYLSLGMRVALVVPNVNLVNQMYSDFENYAKCTPSVYIPHLYHKLSSGKSKHFIQPVLITTWQSMYKMPPSVLQSFDVIIGDEAHTFAAKSLNTMMSAMTNANVRIGTTGTIANTDTHKFVLQGHFGKLYEVISTQNMISVGAAVPLTIKMIRLNHGKNIVKMDFDEETKWLVDSKPRIEFVANLAVKQTSASKTILILVKHIKYGIKLFNLIKNKHENTHFISGAVTVSDRELILNSVRSSDHCSVIVASYGTMSTGITIPALDCIMFAQSGKSKIRNLQSIGRGMGLSIGKSVCHVYDFVDSLPISLCHASERYSQYISEGHRVERLNFNLGV
jgi:superfamily II DNA or RNA helicase